jgi:ubiquinone/menaquinone biosynthesis C-methylase UbiE
MITEGLGRVLPEFADTSHVQRVLDVGCGTGGWLMEVACTYLHIEQLVGVDISNKMVERARMQAMHLGLEQRVEFQTMDALRMLEFPPASFDLVNQRLGASWVRHWEWRKLLLECQRVAHPRGTICLTEAAVAESNSPALTTLCSLAVEACFRSGRFFEQRHDGIISKLVHLMTIHGIENIQTQDCTLTFRAGTSEHQSFYEDMRHLFRVSLPFFDKWIRIPRNYEEIYQQALSEMQQPEFLATWLFRTVWGTRNKSGPLLMQGLR